HIGLSKGLAATVVSIRQNIQANLIPQALPAGQIGFQVETLGQAYPAIERDPAHNFGIDIMALLSPHLPDPRIRLLPVRAYIFYEAPGHLPHGTGDLLTDRPVVLTCQGKIDTVEYFPKDVKLPL